MSEYTPTTEEMRETYHDWMGRPQAECFAEFDRWLIAERKRVADMAIKKERRRAVNIIMANIGKVVWQVKTDQESIDMTEMYEAIMGES